MKTIVETDSILTASTADLTGYQTALDLCVHKTRGNILKLAEAPKAAPWAVDGNYFGRPEHFYWIGNWTSSFFTGMALLAWGNTQESFFLEQVLRLAPHYRRKVFECYRDTDHGLGFLYSLCSVVLWNLTGCEEHRQVGLRAAELLYQRFSPKGCFVRAWGRMDTTEHENMAVIDSLMSLPLLYWASEETRNPKFYACAKLHANMVAKYFIRPDGSVCHAYCFDLKTRKPIGPRNFCGHGVDSYWARGAAWAIYGFALSYRHTRDVKYLSVALRLAKIFISELDSETVPAWDFRLPPGSPLIRDTSAAVIAVCGFHELNKHHAADFNIVRFKQKLLKKVCDNYLDFSDKCLGVLKSAYGAKPAYSIWGDYFLMEALTNELSGMGGYW